VESADRVGVRHSRRHHLQTAQCRGQGRRSTIRFCLLLRSSLAQGHRAGSDGFSAGPDGGCGLCSAVRRMALLRPHVPVYSPPQWDLFCGFSVKFPGVPVAGLYVRVLMDAESGSLHFVLHRVCCILHLACCILCCMLLCVVVACCVVCDVVCRSGCLATTGVAGHEVRLDEPCGYPQVSLPDIVATSNRRLQHQQLWLGEH
jgi:hypothetical protein